MTTGTTTQRAIRQSLLCLQYRVSAFLGRLFQTRLYLCNLNRLFWFRLS